MANTYHEVEAQALSLQAEDRAHLLERLIESFEPATKIEAAWVAEAIRRRDEVKSGKVSLLSGDEVVAGIKARLS